MTATGSRLATLALATASALAAQANVVTADAATLAHGAPTVADASPNAFGFPSPLLTARERRAFAVGNSFFKQNWVTTPSSAAGRDGLGPLFHARSCSACHLRDGRSRPPEPGETDRSGLLVRIGVRDPAGGPDLPHPWYGAQVQDDAIHGVAPEARVELDYDEVSGVYGDGTAFTLLRPRVALRSLGYGDLGDGVVLGARVAPHLVGLGLLEAVPLAVLEQHADPDDRDGDGVSGRIHWLDGGGPRGERVPGRFGWKATQPDVAAQTAAAFANDMGITSPLVPIERLTPAQVARVTFVPSDDVEIDAATFERVVFYTRTLAVPAARAVDEPRVRAGRALFDTLGCVACHVPELRTADAFHPAFAGRTFAPFTDLLLHDLGEGLADEKHDGDARPAEWRTPPLWGLGLVATVNGHTRLLHDGRARGFAEAVLWHGGEAHAARERFRLAPAAERAALLAFLQSL
jgi:CxxC motif-containing protein (DUF1111 family)